LYLFGHDREEEHQQREKHLLQRETIYSMFFPLRHLHLIVIFSLFCYIDEKAEKWEQTENVMAQNAAKFSEVVHLNIGTDLPSFLLFSTTTSFFFCRGQTILSTKSPVTSTEGQLLGSRSNYKPLTATATWRVCLILTYFLSPLSTPSPSRSHLYRIFIDRDRKHFQYIHDFVRTGIVKFPPNFRQQMALEKEFEYFQLPIPKLSSLFLPRTS
jgi:hypothetical protein